MPEPKDNVLVPVLLSGGEGKRLWPLSRLNYPKQFLRLYNAKTLIQNTVLHCEAITSSTKPVLVGSEADRFIILSQLKEIDAIMESILLEPSHHNTAAAVAVAALWISQHFSDPLMLILPVDHKIDDVEAFARSIELGRRYALQDYIVTFGVKPKSANPNYGYIEINGPLDKEADSVKSFIEKPDKALAETLFSRGKHYWNSGIYLFKASRILQEFEKSQPEILSCCCKALKEAEDKFDCTFLNKEIYKDCTSISFDHAIIEKANNICMVPLESDWKDIGNWQSLYDIGKKDEHNNVVDGNFIPLDTENSYLRTEDKLIATIGIKDCFIIESRDVILIANKNNIKDMRELTDVLEKNNRTEINSSPMVYRPWGYFLTIETSVNYQIKKIVVYPKQSISLQEHQHRSEHWVIIKGIATVTLGTNVFVLHPNESVFVPVGSKHRMQNEGESNLEVIEIQTGSYLGEDDIKRFDDLYARELEK